MLLNEADRRRQSLGDLFPLLLVNEGRQDDFFWLSIGRHGSLIMVGGSYVVPCKKLAGNVAATDAHHVKNRCVRGL